MTFSVSPSAKYDFTAKFACGELISTPMEIGVWSVLKPAGVQNHAPQLCWIAPDQLACVWMAGDREGTSGMSIFGSVLNQKKQRWSEPRLISQHPGSSEQNPFLFKTEDGRLHLIHTCHTARDPNDTSWQDSGSAFSMQWTARLFHQSVTKWGGRWTRSTELFPEFAFCRHPPLKLENGEWLLPIYRSLEKEGAFGYDSSLVLSLDSSAKHVHACRDIPNSTGRVHGSLVYSAEGDKLLQFFRSRLADRIYKSVGSLDGETWSEPVAVDLPNNNSSIQALRLSNGLLVMVFNRFSRETSSQEEREWGEAVWPNTRWPLSVAVSVDDGDTWPWIRDIDTGDGFVGSANWYANGQLAYPSVVEGNPGELHIAYSWANRLAIRYVCLNVVDIIGYLGPQGN